MTEPPFLDHEGGGFSSTGQRSGKLPGQESPGAGVARGGWRFPA